VKTTYFQLNISLYTNIAPLKDRTYLYR